MRRRLYYHMHELSDLGPVMRSRRLGSMRFGFQKYKYERRIGGRNSDAWCFWLEAGRGDALDTYIHAWTWTWLRRPAKVIHMTIARKNARIAHILFSYVLCSTHWLTYNVFTGGILHLHHRVHTVYVQYGVYTREQGPLFKTAARMRLWETIKPYKSILSRWGVSVLRAVDMRSNWKYKMANTASWPGKSVWETKCTN